MSFRRADGTVIGSHVGSRGTLSSVKNYGGDSYFEDEDDGWDELVLMASLSLGETNYYKSYCFEEDCEALWGIYDGDCPYVKREFDPKYFKPAR